MSLQEITLKANWKKHTSGRVQMSEGTGRVRAESKSWRWETPEEKGQGRQEMEWRDNWRHISAFLPLIGVPPGEVIWMQIRLERSISTKRKGKKIITQKQKVFLKLEFVLARQE